MTRISNLASIFLLALFSVPAVAQGATTTAVSSVNVRAGPGINFALRGNLVAGQVVTVIQCQNNWCLIDSVGPDGWVSAEYLASAGSIDTLPPAPGPSGNQILTSATLSTAVEPGGAPYVMVNLTGAIVQEITAQDQAARNTNWVDGSANKPFVPRLNTGDVLQMTIFESADGGLFVPRGGGNAAANFVTFPPQTIDENGNISVPFAGEITAAGLSLHLLEEAVEKRLESRAIEPQVVITMVTRSTHAVTVLGSVKQPQRMVLNQPEDRILDAIASAGGLSATDYDSYVQLTRGGREWTIGFSELSNDPSKNIYLQPGDVVYIGQHTQSFIALGALASNGEFDFAGDQVTLSQALGRAGGLHPDQADPGQVFVVRRETRETLQSFGIELGERAFPPALTEVAVAYRVNLSDPASFMLATRFPIRDGDMIYVAVSASAALATN